MQSTCALHEDTVHSTDSTEHVRCSHGTSIPPQPPPPHHGDTIQSWRGALWNYFMSGVEIYWFPPIWNRTISFNCQRSMISWYLHCYKYLMGKAVTDQIYMYSAELCVLIRTAWKPLRSILLYKVTPEFLHTVIACQKSSNWYNIKEMRQKGNALYCGQSVLHLLIYTVHIAGMEKWG